MKSGNAVPGNGHKAGDRKGRKKLPIAKAQAPGQVGCLTCALCCTYIAVEVDGPDDVRCATEILWYLYHENISVYWEGEDKEEDWYLQFETRCRNLLPDNKCAIYEQRPLVCREYAEKTCEVNAPGAEGITFSSPGEFLEYLKRERRQLYTHLKKKYVPGEAALEMGLSHTRLDPYVRRFKKLRARSFPVAG